MKKKPKIKYVKKRASSSLDETPNEYFKQVIEKARENRKQGKASPVFETAEEMIAFLRNHGV